MNGDSNGRRAEDRTRVARFSPIQLAIAALAAGVAMVIVLLVIAIL